MDRVYTNYDSDKKIFEEFANENGWEKYPANKIIKVQLKNFDFNSYPYMDTLSSFNLVTGVLTNTLMKEEDWVILQSTNGSYEGSDGVWSEFHQESIPENEAVWCENINSYSWSELSTWLEYKSEYAYDNGGIVYSEYDSSSYFIEDTVYSEITDEYYYLEGGKFIQIQTSSDESDKQWIPEDRTDLYIKIDDQYYYRLEYIKDPYTNEYHFKDEMIDGIRYNVLLLKKLEKELGTVTKVVIKELVDIYKKDNYDKDSIIKSISENKEFKKYILVAWGLSQERKPNEEDMIVALFTHMTSSNTTTNLAFLSHIAKFDDKKIFKKFEYWQVQKQRLINNIRNNFCKSFDVSLFGPEIYKRYLFLNI
jgi:hypothetical protein